MTHATNFKPAKGTALMQRRERRKDVDAFEDAEKHKVRIRDMYCRWPACEYCRRYKNLTLHVAHLKGKGRGGDSRAQNMMLLCSLRHEGPISLHSGDCRISPLSSRGTDGPCIFEIQDEQKGWTVVHVEDGR
jgi:hypothetical protein